MSMFNMRREELEQAQYIRVSLSVAQYITDYINRERENSNTVWRTSCASQIWNGCSALILDALDTMIGSPDLWKERRIT